MRRGGGDLALERWLAEVRTEYWDRLAGKTVVAETKGVPHLVFQVADRRFAVEAGCCRGVVRRPRITRLPGVPPYVLGVAGIRGEVVSATDPAVLLALPGTRPEGGGFLAVLVAGGLKASMWVDRVMDVAVLDPAEALVLEAPWPGVPTGVLLGQWDGSGSPTLRLDPRAYLEATAVGRGRSEP